MLTATFSRKRLSIACGASGSAATTSEPSSLYRKLGKSGLITSKVGLGTLQWGDENCGFNKTYRAKDLEAAFKVAVENGIRFFDTAEVYGYQ